MLYKKAQYEKAIEYYQEALSVEATCEALYNIGLAHKKIGRCVLYCTVLYCIVLYCTVLYCTVMYCILLYCIVLYCIVLYCMHCTVCV